jgi:hypothetical protein
MLNWRWILNLTCRRWDVLYFAYWLSGRANFVQGQQFPMSQWLAKKLPNTWRVGGLGGGRVSTHFFAQAVDYIFCLCIGTREAKWEQRVNKPQEFVLCSHHHMYMKRWGQEKMCYSPHHNMFIPSRLFLLEEKSFGLWCHASPPFQLANHRHMKRRSGVVSTLPGPTWLNRAPGGYPGSGHVGSWRHGWRAPET